MTNNINTFRESQMLVDTHTHLFLPNFKEDLDAVVTRAKDNGINLLVVPAIDIPSSFKTVELSERFDLVYGSVGVHPHDCKNFSDDDLNTMKSLAEHPKIIAIGEIGLDYFYDFTPKQKQIDSLKKQIDLALSLDLPVIIHNRDSDDDMLKVIRSYAGTGLKMQFHCFGGSTEMLQELVAMHAYVSFTGNITFKKMDSIRELSLHVPLPQLMLETDSPFMTPVPHRGKRNEPSYLPLIAQEHAKLRNLTYDEITKVTSFNAFKFFGIQQTTGLTYTYQLGNSLYINVSNRCNADCVFCARNENPQLHGFNLRMAKHEEPVAETYIKEIVDPKKYSEIVFCGYGEPTIRWEIVKQIGTWVKLHGGKTRLNTNGHGNLINKRDITPEMNTVIDTVSISLNSNTREQYSQLMRLPDFYYDEMLDFAKKCKSFVPEVVLSVVNYPEIDIASSAKIAEEIGVQFRVRGYF